MQVSIIMARGDMTRFVKGVIPLLDTNKTKIGDIISVSFDGTNTVAIAEVAEEHKDKFGPLPPRYPDVWEAENGEVRAVGENYQAPIRQATLEELENSKRLIDILEGRDTKKMPQET